jgi:hypothetical protein
MKPEPGIVDMREEGDVSMKEEICLISYSMSVDPT